MSAARMTSRSPGARVAPPENEIVVEPTARPDGTSSACR